MSKTTTFEGSKGRLLDTGVTVTFITEFENNQDFFPCGPHFGPF